MSITERTLKRGRQLAGTLLLLAACSAAVAAVGSSRAAQAQSRTADLPNGCGVTSGSYSSSPLNLPAATVYVRLANNQEPTQPVAIYAQSPLSGVCQLIGSTTANASAWTGVGQLPAVGDGGILVVQGQNLGALPYQAVAQILLVPSPAVCQPAQQCFVNYHGYTGTLQPQTISGETDQVAVAIAKPVDQAMPQAVDYYADDTFLYGSKKLLSVSRKYLGAGVHHINIVVKLSNQQQLVISQTVNMGSDPTGFYTIRAAVYRSHNVWLIAIVTLACLVIIGLTVWLVQHLYRRHLFKLHHGIAAYNAASRLSAKRKEKLHK